ncbi:MAG: hypothetical protein JW855_05025, partial [Gammaproteobacteria bacterium]|nr:hypothetical protein [Gammaproteobacteria bacterium]
FQAPEFYQKHGYKIFAKFPLKTKKLGIQYDYYFIKYLDQPNSQQESSYSNQQLDSFIVKQANINDQ